MSATSIFLNIRMMPAEAALGGVASAVREASMVANPLGTIVGGPIMAAGAVISGFLTAIQSATSALADMASKAADYSPVLAATMAMEEARNLQWQMEKSQRLGSGLATFVEKRGEATRAWDDLKTTLMQFLLPLVTKIMEVLVDFFEWAQEVRDGFLEWLNRPDTLALFQAISEFGWGVGWIGDLLLKISEIAKNTEAPAEDEGNPFVDRLLNFLGSDPTRPYRDNPDVYAPRRPA